MSKYRLKFVLLFLVGSRHPYQEVVVLAIRSETESIDGGCREIVDFCELLVQLFGETIRVPPEGIEDFEFVDITEEFQTHPFAGSSASSAFLVMTAHS